MKSQTIWVMHPVIFGERLSKEENGYILAKYHDRYQEVFYNREENTFHSTFFNLKPMERPLFWLEPKEKMFIMTHEDMTGIQKNIKNLVSTIEDLLKKLWVG